MRKFAFDTSPRPGEGALSTSRVILTLLVAVSFSIGLACADADQPSTNKGPERQSLPTAGTPAHSNSSTSTGVNSASSAQEDPFWAEAAQGGMAEVELGKLASSKAQNADVKRFAEMMVADHGKANEELKSLAAAQNVTLPTTLLPDHQAQLTKLQGLSGADLDKAYVDAMVAAHEKDVAAFRTRSQAASTPELKAFAAKNLPTLEKHLAEIKSIRSKMQ